MQIPSVGRVVHYQAYGTPGGEYKSVARAAIITDVKEGDHPVYDPPPTSESDYQVSLCVLNPTGMFFNVDVPYSEQIKPGHWNWPPRV